MAEARFGKLVVAGVGMIGGSLARALRGAGCVGEIVGVGRSAETLTKAARLGVIDRAESEWGGALAGADAVVLAAPVNAIIKTLADPVFTAALPAAAVVTDAGSVKANIVAAARTGLGGKFSRFVGAHPIAGAERSGVAAADANLFRGAAVVLTPEGGVDDDALAAVNALWESAGARIAVMDAGRHDRILAAASHLPHMLAYALSAQLAGSAQRDEIFACAAGGLRDFTRIASSDAEMWRDIFLNNREALLDWADGFVDSIKKISALVERGDGEALRQLFLQVKNTRDKFVAGR